MIKREEIENIALLSKLSVAEDELKQLTQDLEQMMQFAQHIADADTENVNIEDITLFSPLRQDKVGVSLTSEEVLSNAPKTCDAYFVVKKNG